MEEEIISKLTSKNDKEACGFASTIIEESITSNTWFKYITIFVSLLDYPKSIVRNRILNILAINARWDNGSYYDTIIVKILEHTNDDKAITTRQCIKALATLGRAKPKYISMILLSLDNIDLSKYKDSMTPLIQKDIIETKRILEKRNKMDIWEKLYLKAKEEYRPGEVSPFIYAHNVVCALESENGEIFTGFCIESCCGVLDLCAERTAALNMYLNSGQTVIKRLIAFRDKAPNGNGSGMPCGACREFLMQLNLKNKDMEIMVDYDTREIVTLESLMPDWWGMYRYKGE